LPVWLSASATPRGVVPAGTVLARRGLMQSFKHKVQKSMRRLPRARCRSTFYDDASVEARGMRCLEALLLLHSLTGLLSRGAAEGVALLTVGTSGVLQHASLAFVREVQRRGGFHLPSEPCATGATPTRMGFAPQLVVGVRYSDKYTKCVQETAEELLCRMDDFCDTRNMRRKQLVDTFDQLTAEDDTAATLWLDLKELIQCYRPSRAMEIIDKTTGLVWNQSSKLTPKQIREESLERRRAGMMLQLYPRLVARLADVGLLLLYARDDHYHDYIKTTSRIFKDFKFVG
jgi:hypothetical protein